MRPAGVLALAAFSLRTSLRMGVTRGGLAAFLTIAALGPVGSWRRGQGWAPDPDLLLYGYLVGALFAVRSGLEQQRESGLSGFLRHNMVSPVEHAAAAILSVLGSWAILTGTLFTASLLAGSGVSGAAWHAWVFGLGLSVLLPFVVGIEAIADIRIPLLVPVLGYLALAVSLSLTLGVARTAAILGMGAEPGDLASSLRLVTRAALIVPPGFGLLLAATWARERWRGRPLAAHLPAHDTAAPGLRGREEELRQDHHRAQAGGRAP
jgi:hypothetical protein